ncbi:MAG: transporter substrate-binding domain-containing protein [Pseudomonadota bacterium]
MHRVWIRAFFSGFFCLAIGFVAFSCQWLTQEKPEPSQDARLKTPVKDTGLSSTKKPEAGSVAAAIKERSELRVGMQVGYIPFQMLGPDGTVIGYDADCAAMAAQALGVGLKMVRLNWQELIPSLLAGKIDVVMSGMTITPERNLDVVFTNPVLETGRMLLVHRKNADRIKKPADLDQPGVFVVSSPGGLGRFPLRDHLPNVAYREFPDRLGALTEIIQGRATAYIDEEFSVRMACAKHPDKIMGYFNPLTYEPVAWAIRPGDPHWLNWLNNLILIAQKEGRLDDLRKKWMHDYFLDIVGRPQSEEPAKKPAAR